MQTLTSTVPCAQAQSSTEDWVWEGSRLPTGQSRTECGRCEEEEEEDTPDTWRMSTAAKESRSTRWVSAAPQTQRVTAPSKKSCETSGKDLMLSIYRRPGTRGAIDPLRLSRLSSQLNPPLPAASPPSLFFHPATPLPPPPPQPTLPPRGLDTASFCVLRPSQAWTPHLLVLSGVLIAPLFPEPRVFREGGVRRDRVVARGWGVDSRTRMFLACQRLRAFVQFMLDTCLNYAPRGV